LKRAQLRHKRVDVPLLPGRLLFECRDAPPHPHLRDQAGDRQSKRNEQEDQGESNHVSTSALDPTESRTDDATLPTAAWYRSALL